MLYFIIAFIIVLADQATKYLTTLKIGPGGQLEVIPGIVRLTYVQNTGGAFSMFSDKTLILAIISAVAIVVLILLIILAKFNGFGKLSLAFILGGAIGNLIDRLAIGYVVDMIEPTFITFAVFNVADIFVTIGALFLIIYLIFGWRPGKEKAKKQNELPADGPAPYSPIDHKPRNAKERRAVRRAKKYGPDIDESTVTIPVKEVQAAVAATEKAADPDIEIFPDMNDVYDKATSSNKSTFVDTADLLKTEDDFKLPEITQPVFDMPKVVPAKTKTEEELGFTLDDILKEYGYGD